MAENRSASSVLIALNDLPTVTVLSYHLERCGFIINSAQTMDSLVNMIESIGPSLIVLDESLPGNPKPEVLCSIIKNSTKLQNIKIIYACKTISTEIKFIDDQIIKPFVPSELVGKIKALIAQSSVLTNRKIIKYNDIEMNLSTFRVNRLGKTIHLGPNEFKILQCFLELPGKTLSREHIMNYVWGPNSSVEPRTIDVHINRLRSALKVKEEELPLIKTIRSAGYALHVSKELISV